MSKQLKGPWTAIPTGLSRSGLPEHEIHWSDQGECVAEIVHGEEAARAIAALPDLLEALEWIVQPDIPIGSNAEFQERAIEVARAAIAKAKGPQ